MIARYIKLRTGKTRTRKQVGDPPIIFLLNATTNCNCICERGAKILLELYAGIASVFEGEVFFVEFTLDLQVSSHIQVLARRKLREIQAKLKVREAPVESVRKPTRWKNSNSPTAKLVIFKRCLFQRVCSSHICILPCFSTLFPTF